MSTSFPQATAADSGPVELFDAKTSFTPSAGYNTDDDFVASYIEGNELVIYMDVYREASASLATSDNLLLGIFDAAFRPSIAAQNIGEVVIGGNRGAVMFTFNFIGQLRARPLSAQTAAAFADFEVYGLRVLLASNTA